MGDIGCTLMMLLSLQLLFDQLSLFYPFCGQEDCGRYEFWEGPKGRADDRWLVFLSPNIGTAALIEDLHNRPHVQLKYKFIFVMPWPDSPCWRLLPSLLMQRRRWIHSSGTRRSQLEVLGYNCPVKPCHYKIHCQELQRGCYGEMETILDTVAWMYMDQSDSLGDKRL